MTLTLDDYGYCQRAAKVLAQRHGKNTTKPFVELDPGYAALASSGLCVGDRLDIKFGNGKVLGKEVVN